MAAIQLFLEVIIEADNPGWYERVSSKLKNFCATEQVVIIWQDEPKTAQIDMSYEMQKASLNEIELIITIGGASINGINIHLPPSITGFADPYHASAVSLPLEENMKKINGLLGGEVSSNGEVKIKLDPLTKDKQRILEQVLKILSLNNIS